MTLSKLFTYCLAAGSALFAVHLMVHCIILCYR